MHACVNLRTVESNAMENKLPEKESLTVEFKKDPPAGLSDRTVLEEAVGFANAQGGTIFIGVNDDGTVSGVHSRNWEKPDRAVALITGNTVPPVRVSAEMIETAEGRILAIHVAKATGIVSTKDGKTVRRRIKIDGTPENLPFYPWEYNSRLSDLSLLDYSATQVENATVQDLDAAERQRLRRIIRMYHGDSVLLELGDEDLDKALSLVKTVNGEVKPTVAGLVLIGRPDRLPDLLPTSGAAFQVLQGTDVKLNEDIRLPLLAAFEQILTLFKAWNPEHEVQEGLFRVPIPEFSERAFREGIVNAFCHRDYSILGRVSVQISDDGLSITSPGSFIEGVTLENILTVEPKGRNPVLCDVLKRIGLAERTGRGVDRIFEGSIVYGRPWPDYSESNEVSVRLFIPRMRADMAFHKMLMDYREKRGNAVSLTALMILSALKFSKRLTTAEISEQTHINPLRLRRQIEQLIEDGLIEAVGSGRAREYVLSSTVYRDQEKSIRHVRIVGIEAIKREELVLRCAQEAGSISRADVMELLGITGPQAYRILQKLVKSGQLSALGEGKKTRYTLQK